MRRLSLRSTPVVLASTCLLVCTFGSVAWFQANLFAGTADKGAGEVELPQDLLRTEAFTTIPCNEPALAETIRRMFDSTNHVILLYQHENNLVLSTDTNANATASAADSTVADTTSRLEACEQGPPKLELPPSYHVVTATKTGAVCSVLDQNCVDRIKTPDIRSLQQIISEDSSLREPFAARIVAREDFQPCNPGELPPELLKTFCWEILPGQHVTYKDGSTSDIFPGTFTSASAVDDIAKIADEKPIQIRKIAPRRKIVLAGKNDKYSVVFLSDDTGPLHVTSHGIQPPKEPLLYLFRTPPGKERAAQHLQSLHWYANASSVGGRFFRLPFSAGNRQLSIENCQIEFMSNQECGDFCRLSSSSSEPMPHTLSQVKKSVDLSIHNPFGFTHWAAWP